MLTKILHAKDCSTVLGCIKVAECTVIAQAAIIYIRTWSWLPLWVREDINICFLSISNGFRSLVHLYIVIRHILEVNHPVVH